ncbi:Metalloenzyme, LuxS/M16 peptidase-like protein, partial [Ochromonadaceae sp. CCMP2298]
FAIAHLLGHEGAGSLRSLLVKRGWINSIGAYVGNDVSDMQLFDISLDLTEEGFKHRYEAANMVFAYIDLLKAALPQYLFDELRTLSHVAFDYSEKQDPASYVSTVASNMQSYPLSEYLTGPQLYDHPGAGFQDYLAHLTPENAHLIVTAPEFKDHTQQEGKYYKTQFNNKPLPAETAKWSKTASGDFPELAIPLPNVLIPEDFTIISKRDPKKYSEREREALLRAGPELVRSDEKWEVWHKLDEVFEQPKVYAIIALSVPQDLYDVHFVINSKLFVNCFMDSINEFLYDARLAGLGFEIEFTSKGVQLILSGYSDKLPLFTEQVVKALGGFKPDPQTFRRFKDLLEREYTNWSTQQPYYHSSYYASLLSETLQYPIGDL